MSDVFLDETALDSFGCHLGLLVVLRNVQAVHFRSKPDELARRPSVALVFEFADDFGVDLRVQITRVVVDVDVGLRVKNSRDDGVAARIEVRQVLPHHLEYVDFGDMVAQRVCTTTATRTKYYNTSYYYYYCRHNIYYYY